MYAIRSYYGGIEVSRLDCCLVVLELSDEPAEHAHLVSLLTAAG